jgi:hypothetical protein
MNLENEFRDWNQEKSRVKSKKTESLMVNYKVRGKLQVKLNEIGRIEIKLEIARSKKKKNLICRD